jgi:hypothetical protein
MPAIIKESEIEFWRQSVVIKFGFSGLNEEHTRLVMRKIISTEWPDVRRPDRCVYVIRLGGEVAIDYPDDFSPVIYIGEGSAYDRVLGHADWLAPLVVSVPQLSIEVNVATITRSNNTTLYQHVEADLLAWFHKDYGALPWFNQQFEKGKEGVYEYEDEARKALRRHIGVGAGKSYKWAIKPTRNNDQFERYQKGQSRRQS